MGLGEVLRDVCLLEVLVAYGTFGTVSREGAGEMTLRGIWYLSFRALHYIQLGLNSNKEGGDLRCPSGEIAGSHERPLPRLFATRVSFHRDFALRRYQRVVGVVGRHKTPWLRGREHSSVECLDRQEPITTGFSRILDAVTLRIRLNSR